ncbi:MAG: TonB family protein [Bacteroidales bacterium]|nr:TonB family protein [Bacteroidales bacterium]
MMEAFALYLLKSVVWLTGFSLVYLLFLRNERFFMLKRIYMISGLLASIFFPLISIHYQVEVPTADITAGLTPEVNTVSSSVEQADSIRTFDYKNILFFLYLSGVLVLAFAVIKHLGSLYKTIRRSIINKRGPAKLVRASGFPAAFSFFNYIFIDPSVNENEVEEIMNHEMVHVRQKHWFDLLVVELLRLFQWVNPFAWIYTGFIRLNHEYLADEAALQHSSNPANYKAALVNQLFSSQVISLSNSFNYSLNKKRFEMMKNIITSPYRKLKVLFALPVFAIVFYAFATPEYHYTALSDNAMNINQAETTVLAENTDSQEQSAVRIRNSDGSQAKPLVVVDGVIRTEGVEGIDPSIIASISVLKDSRATEKYGEKGKDGVIEITTKKKDFFVVEVREKAATPPTEDTKTIDQVPGPIQKGVRGIVLKEDGTPLEGANITSTGTMGNVFGATTGSDGRFAINNIQPDASLLFFCRGYKLLTLKADFNKEMTVKLERDPEYKAPAGPNAAAVQRPNPIVVIDGVITDKSPNEVRKELGYNMGIGKAIYGKEATDKYGEKGANGVYEIITRKKALEMGLKPPFPRLAPEDYPTFQNQRFSSFNDWIASQVKYPEEAKTKQLEGWVSVNFTVELNGTLSNIVSAIPVNPILSDEVIRVVKSAPNWEPPKNPNVDESFTTGVTLKFKLPDQIINEAPFVVVEEMPLYPGGDAELLNFIKNNTKYPEEAKAEKIEGRVIVRFVISTEGRAEAISVLKGVHPLLDAEAIRVVSLLSGFKPGKQGGKAVNVWYMVPINFNLTPAELPK